MKFYSIIPMQMTYLLQRFGKYHKTLEPGLNFYIPFIDRIEAKISLKEQIIKINEQSAVTKDNVVITLDGVVFFRIQDAYKAYYSIDDYESCMFIPQKYSKIKKQL